MYQKVSGDSVVKVMFFVSLHTKAWLVLSATNIEDWPLTQSGIGDDTEDGQQGNIRVSVSLCSTAAVARAALGANRDLNKFMYLNMN